MPMSTRTKPSDEMGDQHLSAVGLMYGPDVKMKLTKAGLTFSGPSAFVSNTSPSDFAYKGQPYSSAEQGIQHLNVVHHKVPDIAAKIPGTICAKKIKKISHDIPKSESWPKIAPGLLLELNEATEPCPLEESSGNCTPQACRSVR